MNNKHLFHIAWVVTLVSLPFAVMAAGGPNAAPAAELPVLQGSLHQAAIQMVGAQAEIDALRAQVKTLSVQNATLKAQVGSQSSGLIAAGMGMQQEINRSDMLHALAAAMLVIIPFCALLWYAQSHGGFFKRKEVAETIAA